MVSTVVVLLLGTLLHREIPCLTMVELPAVEAPLTADLSSAWETAKRYQQTGEDHRRKGDLAAALADFEDAAKIMERLVALHSENIPWKRDLSLSEDKIGDVLFAQGNLPDAKEYFRTALTLRKSIAAADPTSREWQRNVSVSHNKIGDTYMAQGNLKAALESYLAAYGLVQD
jgi:tetratricopeptide (TPR) repeat protein